MPTHLQVRLWDLRGGRDSTVRFGGVVHSHPTLAAFNLKASIAEVPGLTEQTDIPHCSIQQLKVRQHLGVRKVVSYFPLICLIVVQQLSC
jgi:hypothetical protein